MNQLKLLPNLLLVLLVSWVIFGAGKCFGQDSTSKKFHNFPHQRNILIVESTQTNAWFPPQRGYFKVGHRVKVVRRSVNTKEKGRIQYISDSSLFINGNEIKLKDIAVINKCRGKILTAVGGTTLIVGLGLLIHYEHYYENYNFYAHGEEPSSSNGPILGSAAVVFAGLIATLVGGIKWASAKQYYMDENWKFEVKPDIFAQPGMMKFPGKTDTVRGNSPYVPGKGMKMPGPFPGKK